MDRDRIVAVALLTEENMKVYGSCLSKVFPIDETPCFTELIDAIDRAEQQMRERDPNS
jgi:hypothetical protein